MQKFEEKKSCRVTYRLENVNITDKEEWDKIKIYAPRKNIKN